MTSIVLSTNPINVTSDSPHTISPLNAFPPPRYASRNHARLGIDLLDNGLSTAGTLCRDGAVGHPNVDERQHGLQVALTKQSVQLADAGKEAERAIQVVARVLEVPEWLQVVAVVEMGVDTKHLAPGGTHVTEEGLWETSCFAEPVATGEIRESAVEGGRACGDGSLGA